VVAQFCNGARVPPENCAAQAGQLTQASCKGYNTPVGASETTGLTQQFTFNGIQPTATVDEGHNWLNLVFGPLSLSRPNVSAATNAEMMLASRPYGTAEGAYSIPAGSTAVNRGTTLNAPATDFYGNARSGRNDAGAVQYVAASFASVAPTALAFGDVRVNGSAQQTLTLSAGSAALNGTSIAVSGAGFARPAVGGGSCPVTATFNLAANTSCTLVISFAPTAVGAAAGAVTVGGTVVGSPVALSGNAVRIDLTVSPSPLLAFGDVFVGSPSAAQTVTLTNTGTAAVTGIAAQTSAPFAVTGSTCPASLAAGASCTLSLVLTPTALNPVVGALAVKADTGFRIDGSPLQLSGNGVQASVAPTALTFGSVPTGTAVLQTLTFSMAANSNSGGLPALTVTVSGAGFSRASGAAGGSCGAASTTATSCTLGVQFLPTAVGAAAGAVSITGISTPVPLTGNGIAPTYTVSISALASAFGNQVVGTVSAPKSVTVTNTGNSPLSGLTFTLGGGTPQPFSRVTGGANDCGASLAVGAACTLSLQFAPTAAGAVARTLTVAGGGVTPMTLTLTGTGTVPSLRFSSVAGTGTLDPATHTTLNFGTIAGNGTSTATLTLTVGASPITFGLPTVSGAAYGLGITKTCNGAKAANTTCTLSVTFNASGTTLKTGTLSVPYTGGTGSPIVLNLSGS
jgi:hypothetical protein